MWTKKRLSKVPTRSRRTGKDIKGCGAKKRSGRGMRPPDAGFKTALCTHCKQKVSYRASHAVGEIQRGRVMPRAHKDRNQCN